MEEKNHKIRIKDIARLAGVSEGTVDRVLHNRGDVSEKSKEAVKRVLDEMNYTPNLFARSLASKKQYRFVSLIPLFKHEDYWESVDKGFDLAANDFIHYNVVIEKKYFNQFDVNSFIDISNKILESEPDAVFFAPIFRNESTAFSVALTEKNIPFSFVDSMIPETGFLTYYGQNSFQSGYLAARLLLSTLPENSQVMIIRTKRKGSVSNQTLYRYQGFMQYMENAGLDSKYELINVELNPEDDTANSQQLSEVLANNSRIAAAITFNSKVYRLADHLENLHRADIRLIGYDLLTMNVRFLEKGIINCLIAQRPDKQSYFTVRDMCRELIFHQEIRKINYVPIDVLFRENIGDYLNFVE